MSSAGETSAASPEGTRTASAPSGSPSAPPADATGSSAERLLAALERLRAVLAGLRLPLELGDVERARTNRVRLVRQLDDYVLPRLRQLDAPLLAVVGGSTGAGKSTLVNSLLGEEVSRAGVLRPTTRSPVLAHHPDDAAWFLSGRVLPSLARLTGGDSGAGRTDAAGGGIGSLRLVPSTALPPGLALLDAPDIDSVVEANRELATQLLAAADLWLFVTTASRYADAVPWELLRTAAERGTSVAVVLDRVPQDAMDDVRSDLAVMLRDNDLATAPLFTVREVRGVERLLPEHEVAGLRRWLVSLASDARARSAVVRRTLSGAVDSLAGRVSELADAADAQDAAARALVADLDSAYAESDRQLEKGLTDGSLLRGEVLARWQEFVGTGEFFRGLESAISRLRDRVTAALRGRPAPAEPLGEALQTGVHALVRAQAEDAVERATARWRTAPAGARLLQHAPDVTRLSADFDQRLSRQVRDWQGYVFELVREEGQGRRAQARVMSFGVNALGVVLMLVVFASTAFIPTGAEFGVAAGSAVVGQRLLEAVFGDQAVRALAAKARTDLIARVDVLMEQEQARMAALLDSVGVEPGAGDRVRAAGDDVQAAR